MKVFVLALVALAAMTEATPFEGLSIAMEKTTFDAMDQIEQAFLSTVSGLRNVGLRAKKEMNDYTQKVFELEVEQFGAEDCRREAQEKMLEIIKVHSEAQDICLADIVAEIREVRNKIRPILQEKHNEGVAILKELKDCSDNDCRKAVLKKFVAHLKETKDTIKPLIVEAIRNIKAGLPAAVECVRNDQIQLREEVAEVIKEFNECLSQQ